MTCPLTRKQLEAALDPEVARVDPRHVAGCSACQREQRALEALLAALQEPPCESDRDAFTTRVLGQLDAQPPRQRAASAVRRSFGPLACAAAALLLWASPRLERLVEGASPHPREQDARAASEPQPARHSALPASEQQLTSGLDRLVEQFAAHGDFVSAERACAESLAIKAQTLGLEHPSVAEQRATLQILVRLTTDA